MTSRSWHDGPLWGLDTETTGVDTGADRVVSAAIVDSDEERTWLLDPEVEIPVEASQVHGITTARARAEGMLAHVALSEVAKALEKAAVNDIPVVVYRAGFDLTLLSHEFERHGIDQPRWERMYVIDPYVLDKRVDRYRRGKRTLGLVSQHYEVSLDEAHTALADARAALGVARAIGARYSEVGRMNPAELHIAQTAWHAEDSASLQTFLRRKGKDETVDGRWPLQREMTEPV